MTYDKIVKADIEEMYKKLESLKFWFTHNNIPLKDLKKMWLLMDDIVDRVYWQMEKKK